MVQLVEYQTVPLEGVGLNPVRVFLISTAELDLCECVGFNLTQESLVQMEESAVCGIMYMYAIYIA